jgi:membrane-associated phospholipid phosphatase
MFRTDFNHWLQSFESDFLTSLLKGVSYLGLTYPVIIITLIIIGGLHFKKGWIILNIVAYTSILTVWLKEVIDYPRPLAVDQTLETFGEIGTDQNLTDIQPSGFFDLFDDSLLTIIRSRDIGRHGLPSGHTSVQLALWLGMALLFRKRWLCFLSISMIILTMWSRMYLGMHYLGDILGGLAVGSLGLIIVLRLSNLLDADSQKELWVFSLLPLVMLILPSSSSWQVGLLLGGNIAVAGILRSSEWSLSNKILTRPASSIVLIILFLGFFIGAKLILRSLPDFWDLPIIAIAGFVSLSFYLTLARKLSWLQHH